MKTRFLLTGVTISLLSLAGCSNNDSMDEIDQKANQVSITLKADGPLTRADYTDAGSSMTFSWRSGDEISAHIHGVPGNENSKLTTASAGKSVSFNGTVTSWNGSVNVYAFYPYSATEYTITGGSNSATATSTLTLPNPQSYTVDGAISNSFLVGAGTATLSGTDVTATCSMKQVMSIIKLNITNAPAKVKTVRLICSDSSFPTTATVKLIDGTISSPGSFTNTLSMNVTDNTVSSTKSVSFAMFPANLSSKTITIEINFTSGHILSINKTGLTFEQNKHYRVACDGALAVQYISLGGIKWATGNLIADGVNGAKIGAPEDGGLYFQYGSLIGWSGGASGDGTGRTTGGSTPAISAWVTPIGYIGSTTFNTSWTNSFTTDDAVNGKGDPCKFYLGDPWRLPTKDELDALLGVSPSFSGTFAAGSTDSYAVHNPTGLKFPAMGIRFPHFSGVGSEGRYWTIVTPNFFRYQFQFDGGSIGFGDTTQGIASPIRCVQN